MTTGFRQTMRPQPNQTNAAFLQACMSAAEAIQTYEGPHAVIVLEPDDRNGELAGCALIVTHPERPLEEYERYTQGLAQARASREKPRGQRGGG